MIEVLRPGLYDSIQDLGRTGVQQFGVPISGAMDQSSAQLANGLLGNLPSEAVLEMTLLGPRLRFSKQTMICVSGANAELELDSEKIKINQVVKVSEGAILHVKSMTLGARSYLAVLGGLKSESVMGSQSQYKTITAEHRLSKGSLIDYPSMPTDAFNLEHKSIVKKRNFNASILEVLKGPEFSRFDENLQKEFIGTSFKVSAKSNRMAYQFEKGIGPHSHSIITSLVLPGTLQLTPAGKLVVLMRDAQTTGGYPRILQLTEASINLLSQKKPGEYIKFKLLLDFPAKKIS